MKNITLKRFSTLTLAGCIAFSMTACNLSGGGSGSEKGSTTGADTLFKEPTEMSIVIGSHASWPYDRDWKIWEYLKEATGATLNVSAVPDSDFITKITLMMASPENIPDLVHFTNKASVDKYEDSGAFVSVSDNLDKMPNYTKFLNSLSDLEREDLMAQRTSGDGQIYFPPVYGTHTVNNLRAWMYRKDIFKKHNLQVPTTMDELYQVAKKLKKLYPDSYPLCMRDGISQIDILGPQWKKYFTYRLYYDYDNKKWSYGSLEPVAKEIVEYFIKMRSEDLVPPDYTGIATKSWEELVSTDRGFMMCEYLVRLDFFNKPNRKDNPEYTWTMMKPLKGNAQGQAKLTKSNTDFSGYVICNTGKEERINNAFKLVDWMYSDEGSELLSWGKEGETYKVENGKKKFILSEDDATALATYGVGTCGLYQRIDVAANEALYSEDQIAAGHEAIKYLEDRSNPLFWLSLNPEAKKKAEEIEEVVGPYCGETLAKFVLGQRPISEWDQFQKELKDMRVDELVKIYDDEYNRVMNK